MALPQPSSSRVAAIRNSLCKHEHAKKQIKFQGISFHCGIRADSSVKSRTQTETTPYNKLSFILAKLYINMKFKKTLSLGKKWSSLLSSKQAIPEQSRREAVAKFQILTGYNLLVALV